MTTHADLIDSGSLRETAGGITAVTEYLVSGVTGGADTLRSNALQATGVPRLGDPHPSISGISVIEREVVPVSGSPSKWKIRIIFESPALSDFGGDAGAIDVSSPYSKMAWSGSVRSESEEVSTDADGNTLLVTYRGRPVLDSLDPYSGNVTTGTPYVYARYSFVHSAEIERPLMTLTGSRWERDDPERRSAASQGHTNLVAWRGYEPETMLIREISFDPNPQIGGWDVRYVLVYDPRTWRTERTFRIGTHIGFQTPQDATIGNGIERFKMFPTAAFSALGI